MGWDRHALVLAIGCLAATACGVTPASVQCGEILCPAGTVCSDDNTRCIEPAQLEECAGKAEGDPCSYNGISGACRNGYCADTDCGNLFRELGEVCDDGNTIGGDGCSADCRSNEICGNSIVDVAAGETCDDGAQNSDAPDAPCRTDCKQQRCGDGILDTSKGEQCDGPQTDGKTCASYNFYDGTLGCTLACQHDPTPCVGYCGDGVVDPSHLEECDTDAFAGATCQTFGFTSGTLTCLGNCRRDMSTCVGRCGDGVRTAGEQCDTNDFGGKSCVSEGFYTGALSCSQTCDQISMAACSGTCGDGVRNGPEVCDGADMGVFTCASFGFYSGTVSCASDCASVNSSACSGRCGDNTRNGPEVCDGSDLGGLSCESYGYYTGSVTCQAGCGGVNASSCSEYCGDGIQNGPELCDGADQGGEDCTAIGAKSGPLGCGAYCQDGFGRCHWSRWRRSTIGSSNWNTAFTLDANNTWIGGPGGVMHWNGTTWTTVGNVGMFVNDIWASSPTNVWAVSWGGIKRWDGATWTSYATTANLEAVWGISPTDIWAVGFSGAIMRFNGIAWSTVSPAPTNEQLMGVWGSATNNVWAVGTMGTLLHWNGSGWNPVASGTTAGLYDIHGTAANDVWVAGDGLVLHRTAAWASTTVPNAGLKGIFAIDRRDVWAVASGGNTYHYDGATWTNFPSGSSDFLDGVSAASSGDVWAVGSSGMVMHHDGLGWVEAPAGPSGNYFAVAGTGPSDIWMVGFSGAYARFNGTTWATTPTTGTTQHLNGVWALSPTEAFAVGNAGTIRRFAAGAWSTSTSGTTVALQDVWGLAANDMWAVGAGGTVLRFNGSMWSPVTSGTTLQVNSVWGTSATDVWIVGAFGVRRWTGSMFATVPNGNKSLEAIWGSSPNDIWAAGGSNLQHWNGLSWTDVPKPSGISIQDVWGTGPADVWAIGQFPGEIIHWDGSRWTQIHHDFLGNSMYGIYASNTGDVYAVGSQVLQLSHALPVEHGGTCTAPIPISCEQTLFGAVTASAPQQFGSYSCGSRATSGGEVYYKLVNPVGGRIAITLTPGQADLDLVALGADASGGCNATGSSCKAASQQTGTTAETITLEPVVRGDTLYFVVDGFNSATSAYTISVDCTKL